MKHLDHLAHSEYLISGSWCYGFWVAASVTDILTLMEITIASGDFVSSKAVFQS